jgi:hypothetical protein
LGLGSAGTLAPIPSLLLVAAPVADDIRNFPLRS